MRAVIVYESMYGNTHKIADAIADGFRADADVAVVAVTEVDAGILDGVDVLVVGGPTHVHGMTRPTSRSAAVDATTKPGNTLVVEPGGHEPGVREWLTSLGDTDVRAAAFDTRVHGPGWLTGRASTRIARRLRRHGCTLVARPESFLVTKDSRLEPGEEERARRWGARLAQAQPASASVT
jgi:Flavodoxin